MNNSCRSCGNNELHLVLPLGNTPLANSLLTAEQLKEAEPTYPLNLVFCPKCTLVQIRENVPPDRLFRDYLYFSSFSDTMVQHARALVNRLIPTRKLDSQSLVMEVASNDGYLLQFYKQAGIEVLGIDPALNVAKVAQERGIPTLTEFFGESLAHQLLEEGKRADIIHANNVLAHVPDLNGFVEGLHLLLKEDGIAVIETPYVGEMIEHREFDTIYHEHLCYYSVTALDHLFGQHGLVIQEIEQLTIHGGTLRLFVGQASAAQRGLSVQHLLNQEITKGITSFQFYQDFAEKVTNLKEELRSLLGNLKEQGKQIVAYGAAAKGSTLLNYFGIGLETLNFVVDRSTYKQGHFMPGVHLPIYSPAKLLEVRPDYVLLLTWNFADEIIEQQAEYRRDGGHFIVPIPELKVV